MAEQQAQPVDPNSLNDITDTTQYLQQRAQATNGSALFSDPFGGAAVDIGQSPNEKKKASKEKTDTEGSPSKESKEGSTPEKSEPHDVSASDGNEETSQTSDEPDKGKSDESTESKWPKGFRKRLSNARRQIEERDAEIAELKAKLESQEESSELDPSKEEPETEEQEEAGEVNDPFPVLEDYASREEWVADCDRWESGLKLKGGNKKAAKKQKASPEGKQQEPKQQTKSPQTEATEKAQRLLNDLYEALDDFNDEHDSDKSLSSDFSDLIERGQIHISMEMLEWMADNEDGALAASIFIQRPRDANRIQRKPTKQQQAALAKLVGDWKQKSSKSNKSTATKKAETKTIPDVDPLRGGRKGPAIDLSATKDTGEYLAKRQELVNQQGNVLGLSF